MKRKALIFGATGLTGSFLVEQLCESEVYKEVVSFSRRRISYGHQKLREVISDLNDPEKIKTEINGDDLFCCLGTTIKKAGSKKNFRHVDLDLPVALSKIAAQNKIKRFLVISSIGANSKSSSFYLRTKGEMEETVLDAAIPQISIVRPSMLLGPREEFRFGEEMGKLLMKVVHPFLRGSWKKYRGIRASTVAEAMQKIAEGQCEVQEIFESDELQVIAEEGCNS